MANLSLSHVNQKLAYVRVLLKAASDVAALPGATEGLRVQALVDATVFHMVCGVTHYLREIAENYGVKDIGSVNDSTSLSAALAAIDKEAAEAHELLLLSGDTDSWLAKLLKYYRKLWSPPQPLPPVERQDKSENNLIAVKVLDPDLVADQVGLEQLVKWEEELSILIARQRETSSEY